MGLIDIDRVKRLLAEHDRRLEYEGPYGSWTPTWDRDESGLIGTGLKQAILDLCAEVERLRARFKQARQLYRNLPEPADDGTDSKRGRAMIVKRETPRGVQFEREDGGPLTAAELVDALSHLPATVVPEWDDYIPGPVHGVYLGNDGRAELCVESHLRAMKREKELAEFRRAMGIPEVER